LIVAVQGIQRQQKSSRFQRARSGQNELAAFLIVEVMKQADSEHCIDASLKRVLAFRNIFAMELCFSVRKSFARLRDICGIPVNTCVPNIGWQEIEHPSRPASDIHDRGTAG
jgi:hypothetical protein